MKIRMKSHRLPRCKICGGAGYSAKDGRKDTGLFRWRHFDDAMNRDHQFVSDDSKVPDFIRW